MGHEESIARVTWQVHILSYLTNDRSCIKLSQPGQTEEEEEGFEQHANLDAETERIVVLQATSESVRSKFLDCIAQLLSPSKGWDYVAATALREHEEFVAVDVARNDYFGVASSRRSSRPSRVAKTGYFRELTNYVSRTQSKPPPLVHNTFACKASTAPYIPFELLAVKYLIGRIDYWVERLRNLLATIPPQDFDHDGRDTNLLDIKAWAKLTELLLQDDILKVEFREKVVQQAYECVISKEIQRNLSSTSKHELKIWHSLKFLARPLADCRLL